MLTRNKCYTTCLSLLDLLGYSGSLCQLLPLQDVCFDLCPSLVLSGSSASRTIPSELNTDMVVRGIVAGKA